MRWWVVRAVVAFVMLLVAGVVDALLQDDQGPLGFLLVIVAIASALMFVVSLGGLALTALRRY